MKKILFILFALMSFTASAQITGYTTINSRYNWLGGYFRALHIPAFGTTPSLQTGQYTGSGAVGLDSTAGRLYVYIQGSWRRQLNILDTASLLATQYYVSTIVAASNNFANANLTATGNRSHDWSGYDYIQDSIGTYTIRSNQTGTITGQYSILGGKALANGYDIISYFDSDDYAGTYTNNGNGGSNVFLEANSVSKNSSVYVHPDSIALNVTEGNISLSTLDAVSDTTAYKPLAWNPQTKRMVKHNYWPSGGGVPTLQQVLDAGSTLTSTETVTLGTNILIASGSSTTGSFIGQNTSSGYGIRGTSSSGSGVFATTISGIGLEVQGGTGLSGVFTQIPASANTVTPSLDLYRASTSIPSDGIGQSIRFLNAADDEISYFANSFISKFTTAAVALRTSQVDIQGVDNASTETFMNIQKDLVRINNNADTLAPMSWVRANFGSGGGDVTKVGTPVDNQIGVWTGDGTIEGSNSLTWNGTTFAADGGATFNESGANVDFRIEGDADANTFFVDASADAVGIGTNAPAAKLQVMAGSGSLLFDTRPTGASHTRFSVTYSTVTGTATLSSSNGDNEANLIFSSGSDLSNTRPDWTVGKVGGNPNVFKIRARYPSGAFYEEYMNITAQGETVFNEGGLDRDIRFETDNDANGLFINAGTDRIGIGTASPNAWLGIKAGTTASGQINFAPGVAPSSPNDGDLWYEDTNDRLMFRQNATSIEFIGVSAVNSVTPTAQNRTLTVLINGVTYYITAKTTND